jgi:hypothetical protein
MKDAYFQQEFLHPLTNMLKHYSSHTRTNHQIATALYVGTT